MLIDFLLLLLESWGLILFGLLAYAGFRYAVNWFRRQSQRVVSK